MLRIALPAALLSTVFAFPSTSGAQDMTPAEINAAKQERELLEKRIKPKTEEFKQACEVLRKHLKLMREKIIRYNVAPAGAPSRKLYSEFIGMMGKANDLHQQMMAAAIDELNTADLSDKEADKIAKMLVSWTEREVENDRFDGVIAACDTLMKMGYPEPDLPRRCFLAAIATNQYERVSELMNELEAQNPDSELLAQSRDEFPILQQRWEREKRLRQQDAAGPELPRVEIVTTKGIFEIELFENQAPNTVANFIELVQSGFYDGRKFHRVIDHYAAQTGCPNDDGTGDGGFVIPSERDAEDARDFFRGTLGMALANDVRDSASTQFFISFSPTPELDENYTAFGRVIKGDYILGNLSRINPDDKSKKKEEPKAIPDEIISARVLSKRAASNYTPERMTRAARPPMQIPAK